MAIDLPTDAINAAYSYTLELGETVYMFEWLWIDRLQQWTISIYSETGSPIQLGLPVLLGTDLLQGLNASLPGSLIVNGSAVGRDDMGQNGFVTYVFPGEVLV